MTAELHDLLASIDELTKPTPVPLMQKANLEYGIAERIVKRTDPSLLDQLRAAIGSSLGGTSGAGQLARERTPIDMGAFTLYDEIDVRVRAWMLDAGVRASNRALPGDVLRRWYILWTQKALPDSAIHNHKQIVDRWVTSIRDILDPPTRQELTRPCPKCGRRWVTIGKGEETQSRSALTAVWRFDHPELSFATCVGCDSTWLGVGNMRLLSIQLDDKEKVDA